MTAWIGIDPGLKGGIAVIDANGPIVWRMPTIKRGSKTIVDVTTVRDIICNTPGHLGMVMIEKVNAGAVPSRQSAFSFGHGYGRVEAVIEAFDRPLDYVLPDTWIKAFGIPVGAGKAEHIATARRLYPDVTITTDGQADALLIAEWCRRTWGNGR